VGVTKAIQASKKEPIGKALFISGEENCGS
jgi:hypothetical protein